VGVAVVQAQSFAISLDELWLRWEQDVASEAT
jgi:hypothetical protein